MKKMRWMILCMLALPMVSNIKASNCTEVQTKVMAGVKANPVFVQSQSLIEQILFPHSI